jgi:DNA-binding NtrC family response regulator
MKFVDMVNELNTVKKVVLAIDDDKSVLKTFRRILEKAGYHVEVAETGKEALAKIDKGTYDVVLVDFRLPDMIGTDLLLKAKEKLQNVVKIMITGLPSIEIGAKALDEGVDEYLIKPVRPDELLSLMAEKTKTKKSA